jgi:hypothetical protein
VGELVPLRGLSGGRSSTIRAHEGPGEDAMWSNRVEWDENGTNGSGTRRGILASKFSWTVSNGRIAGSKERIETSCLPSPSVGARGAPAGHGMDGGVLAQVLLAPHQQSNQSSTHASCWLLLGLAQMVLYICLRKIKEVGNSAN